MKGASVFPKAFYAFPFTTIFTLIAFWYLCIKTNISKETGYVFSAITLLLLFSAIVIFISYQNNEEREIKLYKLEAEMNKAQTEKAYYDILKKQNDDILSYAHDTKNHLTAIKGLNKNPEIDTYIEKMCNDLKSYTRISHSGNITFDIIIDKYIYECEISGISFIYDVRLSNLAFVSNHDLITIIGNLMDNAVEAAQKSADKQIILETDYRNKYEVLIITNSSDIKPKENISGLMTTKVDKRLHGIGLKSVKKALKPYDGDFSWEYNDDKHTFSLTVMLSMKNDAVFTENNSTHI